MAIRLRISFEVPVDDENSQNMTPKEFATLTHTQLDDGEMSMDDIFELADYETFKVEVVD